LQDNEVKLEVIKKFELGITVTNISNDLGIPHQTTSDFILRKTWKDWWLDYDEKTSAGVILFEGPKILTLDIETAPIQASVWRLFKENIGINQIEQDWYVLSWAAKWYHEDGVMYEDKSDSWNTEDDSELLKEIWRLLDEADIIITQNGKRFDEKKLNARFLLNDMKPPSSYRHIDTLEIAKRHFGFSSNKLEYMTDKLCKKYKKLKHKNYPGFELWKFCLKGDGLAWKEMQDYNINDVLSLEELYTILRPWYKAHPNLNLYYSDNEVRCKCGSTNFEHNGYHYTNLSKFNRFQCVDCGGEVRDRVNLLPKNKRETLRGNII
jgi:hypothetical protein